MYVLMALPGMKRIPHYMRDGSVYITYSFYLVQEAMKRNALIIQMRSKRVWQETLPELMSYNNYYVLRNPRNPAISHYNCPDGFPEMTKILSRSTFLPQPKTVTNQVKGFYKEIKRKVGMFSLLS